MVAVSEKSEASEKSAEKGSAVTSAGGDNRAREWTSHACYNGDVFSLGYLGVPWRIVLVVCVTEQLCHT